MLDPRGTFFAAGMVPGVSDPAALDLQRLVSPAKFAPFLRYSQSPEQAKRLYIWNVELSECFLGPIALVEVAMRNLMNDAMCTHFGVSPATGWHTLALGDHPRIHLLPRHLDRLNRSVNKLNRHGSSSPTGDDVVGATTLGLWVSLVDKGIARTDGGRLDYYQRLWLPFLHRAFPGYSNPRRPGPLRDALSKFERLRNRVAHHERIYNMDAAHQIENIITLATWLDADLGRYIEKSHSVHDCIAARANALSNGDCRL